MFACGRPTFSREPRGQPRSAAARRARAHHRDAAAARPAGYHPQARLCSVPPRRSGHAGCHQRGAATGGAPLNDKIKWQRRRAAAETC